MAGYDRWCPTCGVWVPEGKQRVRADGLRRHAECDTVTAPTKTTKGEHVAVHTSGDGKKARKCNCDIGEDHFAKGPEPDDEMKELAARMAADEANEGNYAAAAELKKFAVDPETAGPVELRGETGPELLFPSRPPRVHHGANCVELLLGGKCNCSAAPTGPLTPGQVLCRVCQLDDRTRAASSPDDELCGVCRADTPKRVLMARRIRLGEAAEWFFGLPDLRDDETAAGSAQRDLVGERVDALMKLADLIQGHPLPYALVNAAEASIREMEVRLVAPGAHELSDVAKEADRA